MTESKIAKFSPIQMQQGEDTQKLPQAVFLKDIPEAIQLYGEEQIVQELKNAEN